MRVTSFMTSGLAQSAPSVISCYTFSMRRQAEIADTVSEAEGQVRPSCESCLTHHQQPIWGLIHHERLTAGSPQHHFLVGTSPEPRRDFIVRSRPRQWARVSNPESALDDTRHLGIR